MLRGAEKRNKRHRLGESDIGKGYSSTGMLGGETAEGREVDWCKLVPFSTNLGRDVGLKGEGEVLWTAQLWVLLVYIFFPFLSGKTGQVPLLGVWGGSWPAPHGKAAAGCLLSPPQPPVSQ